MMYVRLIHKVLASSFYLFCIMFLQQTDLGMDHHVTDLDHPEEEEEEEGLWATSWVCLDKAAEI